MSRRIRQPSRMYYRGWMHVKLQDEMYKRLFAQLHGRSISFYTDESKSIASGGQCELNISLEGLNKIELLTDRRLSEPDYLVVLKLSRMTAKLRVKSIEESYAWERYIRAAGLLELTPRRNYLLPGQIRELEDIIKIEKEMMPDYEVMNPVQQTTSQSTSHPWLYMTPMERHDAEEILKYAENGNMLIRRRPSESGEGESCAFAVSVKSPSMEFKHYRVHWDSDRQEFIIEIKGVTHDRLENYEDLIEYFENRTEGEYRRLSTVVPIPDHPYEDHLFPDAVYENQDGSHYCNVADASRSNHY